MLGKNTEYLSIYLFIDRPMLGKNTEYLSIFIDRPIIGKNLNIYLAIYL